MQAFQLPTAHGAWYHAQYSAGFAVLHGEGSCCPPSYMMLMHFHITNDFCHTLKCCVSFPVTTTPDSPWH